MKELEEQDLSGIALEKNIATLENGQYALVFSLGLGACYAITKLLQPGDHVLVSEDIYGGAHHLIEGPLSPHRIKTNYVDTSDLPQLEEKINRRTKLLWLESPSNPLLRLADLEAITSLAKKHKIITVVDNSLATPCFQKPLDWGADIVLHSTIKHLSGRNDIVGGAIVTNRLDLFEALQLQRNAMSNYVEPIDCFGILKGMRTLSERMRQQEKSAKKIAHFLSTHASVRAVHYPGLASHPQHDLACKQMTGFGSMLAFEMKGGVEAANRLLREMQLFALYEKVENHGGALPARSMIVHASVPERIVDKENYSGADSLVRLTIGLENPDDLINDLSNALRAVDHQLIEFPASMNLRDCV